MRIYFEFDKLPEDIYCGKSYSFWIKKFPCRVCFKDIILSDIIPDKKISSRLLQKHDGLLYIAGLRFETDKNGIFQHVWFELDY